MKMITDKEYCMSSFLLFRAVADKTKIFYDGVIPRRGEVSKNRIPVSNSDELFNALKKQMDEITGDRKAALALSGGIDSAILAKMMPKGSVAYTFKCIVEGKEVVDETKTAACYAKECGLEHRIIPVYWDDFEKYTECLLKHKGAPFHSIEVQIYKAALQAKNDGFDTLVFGEGADVIYGGLNGLLSREWNVGEFIDRYSFVMPHKVMKKPQYVLEPFYQRANAGYIDTYGFINDMFELEYVNSYLNACEAADIQFYSPYAGTELSIDLDLNRIRKGENKYIIRELFENMYKDFYIPEKLPMPRAVNEWLADYDGPKRKEFWPHCAVNMTGDQKWLLWCLERFLNMHEGE